MTQSVTQITLAPLAAGVSDPTSVNPLCQLSEQNDTAKLSFIDQLNLIDFQFSSFILMSTMQGLLMIILLDLVMGDLTVHKRLFG